MSDQAKLHQQLRYLSPDIICSVRPSSDSKYDVSPVIMGDYSVDIHASNTAPIPSLKDILAVTDEHLAVKDESDRKASRDTEKANDLTLKASYLIEKKSNPDITFSAYLDMLEAEVVL